MSDVRDRIKKLLAMANDDRGNEHENETAMRMADKLMRQHNIDVADLEESTGKTTTYIWATTVIPLGEFAKRMTWRPMWTGFLGMSVGKFTDCKVQWSENEDYGHCIKFMGDETDIEYAGWLFKKMRDFGYAESKAVEGKHRDTFLKAYALKLGERMRKLRIERDAALKAAVTRTGTALMVVENKVALRDAEFGKQGVGRKTNVRFASDGFHQGRAAAERVTFNRPIGSQAKQQLS